MFREDAEKYAAKTIAEVNERRKAINHELKDGERRIVIQPEHIEYLFGNHHKVYYLAKHRKGKPVKLTEPTRQDEWV